MDELIYLSATALAALIRTKAASSEEIVRAHLRRIQDVHPKLNAVAQMTADAALARARAADAARARGEGGGPLHGVPMTIKDSIETAGVISAAGTRGRAGYVPARDATTVARLRAAGAILLGTTNVPELACAYETDNLVYGRTNNPYDLSRAAGGSSGGAAALVAAGGSPMDLGTDAGGSIRLPSHWCGVAGLKPTSGRVPRTGCFPPLGGVLETLSQVGLIARHVEDLTLTLPILAGPDWCDASVVPMPLRDPREVALTGMRAAFHTDNGIAPPTPETAEVVRAAARSLSDAGLFVEEDRPPAIGQTAELALGLFGGDGGAGFRRLLQMAGTTEPHPLMQRFLAMMGSCAMSTAELCGLLARRDLFCGAMLSFLRPYDVILSPANAYPALPHGTTWDHLPAFSYTLTYNLTGWPAVVVRCGTSPEGLPIGVQVVARPWREDVALAAAQHLEAALGGWRRPPL